MRLGVFLPNWIGDVVMSTPALDSLRAMVGTQGRMIGVMRPYVGEVLAGLDLFDRSVFYKPKASTKELTAGHVITELKDEHLDAVVLMTNSLRTAWLAWRSGAKERIGYRRDFRSMLLTTHLSDPRKRGRRAPLPQIDSYLNLAYAAGADWRSPDLMLATTKQDRLFADTVWNELRLPEGGRVIVFNTGGAYGDAKSWPAEHFAKLAQKIVSKTDYSVLVNCGPAEREVAREIVDQAKSSRVVSLADHDSPIGLSKEVIRRSQLLVTTDSGPRFFGVAFSKPVISLFGPTDPQTTKTHYPDETPLTLSMKCQPCWERSCPLKHHKCMKDLSVESVYRAVAAKLTGMSDLRAA